MLVVEEKQTIEIITISLTKEEAEELNGFIEQQRLIGTHLGPTNLKFLKALKKFLGYPPHQ